MHDDGVLSYIIPNTILTQDYYKDTRAFLLSQAEILEILSFEGLQFENADC